MNWPRWWPWMRKPRSRQFLLIEDSHDGLAVWMHLDTSDEIARLDFLCSSMHMIARLGSPTWDHDEGIARLIARSEKVHGETTPTQADHAHQ